MEDLKIRYMKEALLKCAEENRCKKTPTFNINVLRLLKVNVVPTLQQYNRVNTMLFLSKMTLEVKTDFSIL